MSELSINKEQDPRRQKFEKAQQNTKVWKEPSPDIFPLESYNVSDKLTIQVIPLEFYRGDTLRKHGEAITEAIKNSDGVIIEYFPQELEKIRNNPLVRSRTNIDWFMPYYEHAAKAAADGHKEVYALDPAHKMDFALVRNLPVAVFGLTAGSYFAVKPIDSFLRSKKTPEGYRVAMAAGLLGLVASGAIFTVYAKDAMRREHKRQIPSRGFTEPNFRRIVVAQGIKQLAADFDADPARSHKNLVLLYPPVHWKGIKDYLEHRDKLNRNFRVASAFKIGGLNESWFSIRNYVHSDAGWQLKSAKPIERSLWV